MDRRSPLKSKPLRQAGQSLDRMIEARLFDNVVPAYFLMIFLWFMVGWEWWAQYRNLTRNPITWALFALIATAIFVWYFVRVRSQIRSLKLGRDGERIVAQYLSSIPEVGVRIFHDIPGEGFNLDHVVISSRGILVVETKTLSKQSSDKVTFDGERLLAGGRPLSRDPLVQTKAQMDWLRRLLHERTGKQFPVRGALVFPGWWVDQSVRNLSPDLWVLEPKALPAFLMREPVRLSQDDVAFAAAQLSQYVLGEDTEFS